MATDLERDDDNAPPEGYDADRRPGRTAIATAPETPRTKERRKEPRSPYIKHMQWVRRLPLSQMDGKGTLAYLALCSDRDGRNFLKSVRTIARETGQGQNTVRRHLERLERFWISRDDEMRGRYIAAVKSGRIKPEDSDYIPLDKLPVFYRLEVERLEWAQQPANRNTLNKELDEARTPRREAARKAIQTRWKNEKARRARTSASSPDRTLTRDAIPYPSEVPFRMETGIRNGSRSVPSSPSESVPQKISPDAPAARSTSRPTPAAEESRKEPKRTEPQWSAYCIQCRGPVAVSRRLGSFPGHMRKDDEDRCAALGRKAQGSDIKSDQTSAGARSQGEPQA